MEENMALIGKRTDYFTDYQANNNKLNITTFWKVETKVQMYLNLIILQLFNESDNSTIYVIFF